MPDVELRGCRTRPLLSYLKALGVFRHAAQADSGARLWWHLEGFAMLRSRFDESELVEFFLDQYAPSPITSPWNGGSGYHQGDNVEAIRRVEGCQAPRLRALRDVIAAARKHVESSRSDPESKISDKTAFLEIWRAACPDEALDWLDTAVVLSEDGPVMNPLLGTGGNDGRFEFSNNFLARLIECLPHVLGGSDTERDASRARLRAALYDEPAPLGSAAVGMFDPGGAGLPNSSSAPTESPILNSWDFVFLLEGASLFGGAAARRLSATHAVFPFTARDPARVGASLDVGSDAKTRGETWLPVWHRPASAASLRRLLSEGRTQDGRQQARAGRGMLRAVADFGVDRGIVAFERVVYAERFGRNYVAVPLGRVDARGVRSVRLLRTADPWLRRVRGIDTASVRRCLGVLDRAAAEVATGADERAALERWLLALAETQLAVGRRPSSRATSEPTHIRPLGGLPRRIVASLPDSVEHRLARALAAVGREPGQAGLRTLVEPVTPTRGWSFAWEGDRPGSALSLLRPEPLLLTLAQCTDSLAATPPERRARLADVAAFLAGQTDDERLVRLAYALSLCEPCNQRAATAARSAAGIDRLYAAARLVTCDSAASRPGGAELAVGTAPEVLSALAAGKAAAAARAAVRRLRADGLAPLRSLEAIDRPPAEARRIAAALAFPLHPDDRGALERIVLLPEPATDVTPTTTEGVLA